MLDGEREEGVNRRDGSEYFYEVIAGGSLTPIYNSDRVHANPPVFQVQMALANTQLIAIRTALLSLERVLQRRMRSCRE